GHLLEVRAVADDGVTRAGDADVRVLSRVVVAVGLDVLAPGGGEAHAPSIRVGLELLDVGCAGAAALQPHDGVPRGALLPLGQRHAPGGVPDDETSFPCGVQLG